MGPEVIDTLADEVAQEARASKTRAERLKDLIAPAMPSQAALAGASGAGMGGWELVERLHSILEGMGQMSTEGQELAASAFADGGARTFSSDDQNASIDAGELALIVSREGVDDAYESRQIK